MIKFTQQELEICYILSKVLNYFTSYDDYMQEVSESNFLKEGLFGGKYAQLKNEYWAIFLLHRKYTSVRNDILAIKRNFSQKDLDKLFCITAWYCLTHPLISGVFDDWAEEDDWNKDEFINGIKKIKNISYLRKKYIDFRTKNHYNILCFMFGFTQYPLNEQMKLLQKDISIHSPTPYELGMYIQIGLSFIVVIVIILRAIWIVRQ